MVAEVLEDCIAPEMSVVWTTVQLYYSCNMVGCHW